MSQVARHLGAIRAAAWKVARIRAGSRGARTGTFFSAVDELDDSTSDATLAVLEALRRFDPHRGDEDRYVSVVLRNFVVTAIRRAQREIPTVELQEWSAIDTQSPPDELLGIEVPRELMAWAQRDRAMMQEIATADGITIRSVEQRARRQAAEIRRLALAENDGHHRPS